MASGAAEEGDGGIPLDIDNVHMLLQVEHEQIQKRTFTNWINAQLAKRCPPSFVSDLFSDLGDGSQLLDLLEVMRDQPLKRQRGHGAFQQRANIETALNFLREKSIKLVNINIPDIIEGRPSIILGLVWTIILRCHIEELACTLSFSSRHSSLDSLASLDSLCGSPLPASPVPGGRASPLHKRFRISAKKALLMWVRDQCKRVGSSISVKDFKSSWRSGEAFLAILCSLRPQLVDLSLVWSRSNRENLEEAFHLAEKELQIPRLLEPQDVDVKEPEEKSIMTYVAQFLKYTNDLPAPDDHLQVSSSERAEEVTHWLQQAFQELSEEWASTENSSYMAKYQVFQRFTSSFTEQRRPVTTLLATIRRRPELSQEQQALRDAWNRLEEELHRCKANLDLSLPPPLDSVVGWLQRAEAALTEEGGSTKDHADAAREARAQQDTLKTLIKEMSHHVQILDDYRNVDGSGNAIVPLEIFDEIKRRVTHIRVTAKYQGIKLEYREFHLTVLDLLNRIKAKIQTWKAPYRSKEAVHVLLEDWHETVERQGMVVILMDTLQNLKEKANAYTSKAALGEDSQLVKNQVKEAESEAQSVAQATAAVRGTMEKAASAWETHDGCLASLQAWLAEATWSETPSPAAGTQDLSEKMSCQAKLNEVGNWLLEVTEASTSRTLSQQLSKVNKQWAEYVKRTKFEVSPESSVGPPCLQAVHSLTQEASWLLRQPLDVASVPLKAHRQKIQLLNKKMAKVDVSSLSSSPDFQTSDIKNIQQTLPQALAEAERICWELQRAASGLEGRLAELDRWSADAQDCCQHTKEKGHSGHAALDSAAEGLISRGLQLEKQIVTEGRDLQDLVERVQRTSPLQHLSTSGMQDRISEALSHYQEILRMFSSLGFKKHADDAVSQTQSQPEMGLVVVARAKHLDQTGNVKVQIQEPSQLSPQIPHRTPHRETSDPQGQPKNEHIAGQDEPTTAIAHVKIQMLPQPDPETLLHTSIAPIVKEVRSKTVIQPQFFSESDAKASILSQSDQPLSSLTQSAVESKSPKNPVLSEHVTSTAKEAPSQTQKSKSGMRGLQNAPQVHKTSPRPPVMDHGEVHAKAQAMARSRLERARVHLQGRIQQAIELFAGREISESQAKKKQRALKILQPVVLDEFLDAVEGFGAFCSGPQLQDLMLLSNSVRKQWEDVRREMAAFIPDLWSQIRGETRTNATDLTHRDSLHQEQVVTDGAAPVEAQAESLRELREVVTPRESSCPATDRPRESNELRERGLGDTVLPLHSGGLQPGGNTPLSTDAPAGNGQSQRPPDAPTGSKDHLTQRGACGSGGHLKPSLRAREQAMKVRLLSATGSVQQTQTLIQAGVGVYTLETKQEAHRTVIPESVAPLEEERPAGLEALERFKKSCTALRSQLRKNKPHLQELSSEPVTTSTLHNQKKLLQALNQQTEELCLDFELRYTALSQPAHLITGVDLSEAKRDWEQLNRGWRDQQMCLNSRMASLQNCTCLLESADDRMVLITQKLDRIHREPVDISSFNLADRSLRSDLKEMGDALQSEMRKMFKQSSEDKSQHPKATCLYQALGVSQLERLRQQQERAQLAVQAVDRFLATVRRVKADITALLARQAAGSRPEGGDWGQERHSWPAAMQQALQTAAEQSSSVDSDLKAAGLTLTMDGVAVTCRDVVTSLSRHVGDVERTLMGPRGGESKDETDPAGEEQTQRDEELNPVEASRAKAGDGSPQREGARGREHPRPGGAEEESGPEARWSSLDGENDRKTRGEDVHKAQTWRSERDVKDQSRGSSHVQSEGEAKDSLAQRKAALLGVLREIRGAAEHLGLREPTLPALQQRTRALTELDRRLTGLLPELRYLQDAPSSGAREDAGQISEVDDVREETTKAITERLEQCRVLAELLKTFQSLRAELSRTLQRAESTISEQASYLGKDNLQRLHTKVQETKAELSGLEGNIEMVRGVCWQLHTQLRRIPECNVIPFETEANTLMDGWLDISERTDSHLENLHRGLTLWDRVVQLGVEVESWTASKLEVFAQSPSFQSEDDIKRLQNEIGAQERSMERFQRMATDIQSLLQSKEPPPELQVAATQIRQKIEQLKGLASEAEGFYRQMEATKGQIAARMDECLKSLQTIQDRLRTNSGSDVATVLAKLEELCQQLQAQDEQAETLLDYLRGVSSVAGPGSLQGLSADVVQLQEKLKSSHDLFHKVEEQTQRNIQDLHRLQSESEHLKRWLLDAEEKAAKEGDLSLLQEEALKLRQRTELLSQLVSSLQRSNLQQCTLVEESRKLLGRYNNFLTDTLNGAAEKQCSVSRDVEVFWALSKSTQSFVEDLRLLVDSALVESPSTKSPVEQRLHGAQAVLNATAEGEARLKELRVTGNGVSQRLPDGDDLKREIQGTIHKTEEQWRDLLRSAEPYQGVLQTYLGFTSSYLPERKAACDRVEELQRQMARLPALFPWPGTAERRRACLLARQLCDESKTLQQTLTGLAERRRELAERTGDAIWKDSSWAELENCCLSLTAELTDECSRLEEGVSDEEHFGRLLRDLVARLTSLQKRMPTRQVQEGGPAGPFTDVPALEALLLELTDIEKDVLHLAALRDSIADSSTVEARAGLSQQVSDVQTHKRALDSSVRENLSVARENSNRGVQQASQGRGEEALDDKDSSAETSTSTGLPEKDRFVAGLFSTLTSPEAEETDFKGRCLKSPKSNMTLEADSLSENPAELEEMQSRSAKLSCKENSETGETMQVLNSSKSCGTVAECQPSGAHMAEVFPDVKREKATDPCHTETQTESLIQTGNALSETRLPAVDIEEATGADAAEVTGPGHEEMTEGENAEETRDPGGPETKRSEVPERRDNALLPKEERESKLPASPEDTAVAQGQPQTQEGMERERKALGLSADPGAGGTTGGSPASSKHGSTMHGILSEIQSLVERSNIINRTPHIDLNWYLRSSPGEHEIRLLRTVQQVLACRYQPAQLDVTAIAEQLEEAEEYRCCVLEQVATMKCISAAKVCDPNALKRAEGQWSAALLDASATVQVKATQLDEVKQYHKQMRMTRAFLEVLDAQKEKFSLTALGSSAVQAEKLHALLQTMEKKKDIMEELLHLSSQLSVHLSDAESSGALLAQLGDVQEEWRLLEGSIKRALWHAMNSTSQSSLLVKEAELLKAKLEGLQRSTFQSNDSKSTLESICLTTDLKLYNQVYLHLQSHSDALVHFSLGQKEKDEIQYNLKELQSLLNVAKRKLNTSTYCCGDISSTKINKQLQDLILWAKQAENHIATGKRLALFPEEARIQIVDMKKFQTDILSRRSKMQAQVEDMKDVASDTEKVERDQVLKIIEDLYRAISDKLDHVLDTMKKHLREREKLLSQLAGIDAWLAETHATRDPCVHVENVSKADIQKLESELESHKLATVEIQSQLNLVEEMAESFQDMVVGLSPGESRYLVNRLSGLWTELDGLLAHEKATSWEIEELVHERTSSDEELSTIKASLKQISADLEQQRFPLTQETLSTVSRLKHMLMENQCQVQELQHCHEAKRSSLLYTIGELQDRCKALGLSAFEQDKYLHLRRQMEESRDIAKEQIQRAKDKKISLGERFRLCQTLLVELPLVKTQCQEAGDQLEAIAQELYPSELNSERRRIRRTVETLVSWEHSVTDDIRILEAKLLLGLRFSSELPALIELFQSTRVELEGAKPVSPDEKAIDTALRRYWVIWRNMESGMRVLEALARKENINLKNHKELYSLRDAAMHECHLHMESLSQARESLKDYQWAAQGALAFLHNAEATFLSAPGGFLDCNEEQRQTQQALEALGDGFQAHICHLVELVPQQPCLSRPEAEQLHISILSQLLVGRAVLEAQAQLRMESLQRCAVRQQSHRSCHEDIRQHLSGFEARLSDCNAAQVASYDKCVDQQKRAVLLMKDLRSLAGKIEDLRAGCPMQGCGVGKDGELGALWRRWVSLRRGTGLLLAHTEQRLEEWKDITTSIEQCCSFLASLQAEVPDSSTVSFTQEEPQELLAQAEMHQASLEQEQVALASLEHRLEHALSLFSSRDPISPGPVGKTLVKIQENVRSLKERNLGVVAAAQAEEKEREQVQEEMGEVEKHVFDILSTLEACSNPSRRQELRRDLSCQRLQLNCIMEGVRSRYAEIPTDIGKRLRDVQSSLQRVEEEVMEGSNPVRKLAGRVVELGSGLEKVKALLQQKSPTFSEAQKALKHVWDELDAWHSRLMLLESEVQDLAEEQPDQAHLLMDQLTQPLQLHQDASQMAERRTSFLGKIPGCLEEFENISYSATCWLEEAQAWLNTPCTFTTAKGLRNHGNSLQLVLEDSERIRDTLQDFRPVLAEVSAVCDMSTQQERLEQSDQQVHKMQRNILELLEPLLQAVVVVEAMEAELKIMEKNVQKIRTILSSMENSDITVTEILHNQQAILANVQSMRRTLGEMERCRGELHLPQASEENLLIFSRAGLLLQPLEELERQLCSVTVEDLGVRRKKEIAESEGTREDPGILQGSSPPKEVREAFEVSNSEEEEEEDEDDKSCHSSSSDTLTCSVPEDPEEMLNLPDAESKDIAETMRPSKVNELETLAQQNFSEVDRSAKAAEDQCNDAAAATEQQVLRENETPVSDPQTKSPPAAPSNEDTRMIPARPKTPFTRKPVEFVEEGNDRWSTAQNQDVDTPNSLEEQKAQGSSKVPDSLPGCKEDEMEQRRWSRLYTQISRKLTTLKKVQEEHHTLISSEDGGTHEKVTEKESISTGSASAVLQLAHESVTTLRQVKSANGCRPGAKAEELYEAMRRVLFCLDTLTELLLPPGGGGEDDPQLRLLQQECVSTELVTLAELLNEVESEMRPTLPREEPDAYRCLTCLQGCLCTVRLVLTSSIGHLTQHLGLTNQHQEFSTQLRILDEFELGRSEIFPSLKNAPSLESVLGRHLKGSPGEKAELQQASRSLLQGITRLLELAEGCMKEGQTSPAHNRTQLQAALCRHKKLLWVLGSQLAFVQHLFQREPEALGCQEDERLQLEVRAKALRRRALEQEVASQRRLQEWTLWEDNCGQLGRVLDEFEILISSGEPEGDREEEFVVQQRLDACQQTLVQLDESRAALGLLLDGCEALQAEPALGASVSQEGGALKLRWRSAVRRTEQEIQRCRDIQDVRARFQTDFASVCKWLDGASKHLKTWSDSAEASDLNQECVRKTLIQLLDFSMEAEAVSVRRASVSREAARLLHLREADCPGLRAQVAQLEVNWSRHTADLSKIQDQLQQRLLAGWPPVDLLSELEAWLKKLEASLSHEKETVLKATDAAQITECLHRCQELRAGTVSGQLLLDFLCQSGPRAVGEDVQALGFERTAFAEMLGALRLQWLHLQRELESQIRGAEQMHQTCADREKRLRHLHGWIEQQKKQLGRWEQPAGRTLAHRALLEWEAVEGRVKAAATTLQEMKTTQKCDEKEEQPACDIAFSKQVEAVIPACEELSQQMEALRPALQQTVAEWSCFDRDLGEITLLASGVRCALKHQWAPHFSLKQVEGYMELLQQLQEKVGKGTELWASVEKSFQSLTKTLHRGAAQALGDQMEEERKRWRDAVQELKDEREKTGQTLSLWQEYERLSGSCSLHLQRLRLQWEELLSPSLSPEQDARATARSVEMLQDVAEDLQSSVGDLLETSKPLIGQLEPLAANLIQSDTRLLSREVLLLSQAMSGKRKTLQDDLEERNLFHKCLQTLEQQMQCIKRKLKAGLKDKDSVKQVLLELGDLFPSLADVWEMSGCLAVNSQEAERLHALSRGWIESMTRTSDRNRELQAERQCSQTFQEKCESLTQVKERLVKEAASEKPHGPSGLQEMPTVHQRLQAKITAGDQLLQGLLCDAVRSMEKEAGEKRSELMAQVVSLRESWLSAVALAGHRGSSAEEELRRRRIYHHGTKRLWRLLRDVDPLLPPAGPALCTLQQFRSCADVYQCVDTALSLHSAVYDRTLAAGKRLCEAVTESECWGRLQSELQAMEEAWKRTTSLLGKRKEMVDTTVQKWTRCQDGITKVMSDLDEVKTRMEQRLPERSEDSKTEKLIQETELALQRLNTGLSELGTMKTDLSQYIAAGDSALLEQQLEQLHGQWEELCMKVSLRKQEIADRLNAWTIFNDKNKEFCDWLTQMENKVCHSGDLSIEEMVEKLKKDCMEEINLFSENKSHLKKLGEQLLLASDEAKQTQVRGSLQEVNQRWQNLFHHIEARVKKLKETLVTMQQLDKNMSNLRSWLYRIEAELSRPITYSVCHHQEIQRRLAEQQELQRDIEQHTEGVASVLSLCDVLLRDEDAAGGAEAESDSLQETSRSLDQRWRTICAMALDRRLRIEETWRLWCKFLDDYSRFEDWLKMAERTAANPNSADVLYTTAKEELKKFEGFQRQVHERLTQLELVNNQYRRLARENRTDRSSQMKATVHEGNRRWDTLHRRVAAILRRLKYFTGQREEFEGTRESMLVWLTELDLQLTNVEHFSESDVHHKMQQLNSFQREIRLNTERIDGLIVFGERLIQRSAPQDAALIEEELVELHTYCQEVFSRLDRFHQRLSQPTLPEEPELSGTSFSVNPGSEPIGRTLLRRSQGSLPPTPTRLPARPLGRSGRETPDSLHLEWDPSVDVGRSTSHEDLLSDPSMSMVVHESPADPGTLPFLLPPEGLAEAAPPLTSTPLKQGYGNGSDPPVLDDEEPPAEPGLAGLTALEKRLGVIQRWELQIKPQCPASDLDDITSWLETVIPELERLHLSDPPASIKDMEARAKELKRMQRMFIYYMSVMLSVNLRGEETPELRRRQASMNRHWSRACTGLQRWEESLRENLMRCQEFHESLHSLLLWLDRAESRRHAVDIGRPDTPARDLGRHRSTLADLQEELRARQAEQASLQALWSQLRPEHRSEESDEAQEKLHVTGSKLRLLLRDVDQDLSVLQQRLGNEPVEGQGSSADPSQEATHLNNSRSAPRRESSPPRSFFSRVLRAAFPLQLLLLLLVLLPCLIPLSENDHSCTVANNFARSFYPMLHYTDGPPPT